MNREHICRYWFCVLILAIAPACISAEPVKTPPDSQGSNSIGGRGYGTMSGSVGAGGDGNSNAVTGDGGTQGEGGDMSTGGIITVTGGGMPATGGAPPGTGGAAVAVTGGTASVGSNPSCDFSNAACTAPCGTVNSWETTACTSLLTCLDGNSTCISTSDLLCATKAEFGNPICTDIYQLSDNSKTVVGAYVTCACGL